MSNEPKIILLADDDLDDQELLEEAFLQMEPDADIHTVSSGKGVLEYLQNCPDKELPCMIVLDYNMPDWNGAEILDIICHHARYKHIPAVIWSTSDAVFYKEICMEKGAKKYFHKPHRFEDIMKLAAEMLSMCTSRVS